MLVDKQTQAQTRILICGQFFCVFLSELCCDPMFMSSLLVSISSLPDCHF